VSHCNEVGAMLVGTSFGSVVKELHELGGINI
jgi:hypothetical protein